MAAITVSNGQSSAAVAGDTYTVQNGGTLTVSGSGLVISSTVVSLGGKELVSGSGSATGDTIFGALTVSGGSISNETIEAGGSATLNAGAVDSGMTILAGGTLTVSANTGSATLSNDLIHGTVSTVSGKSASFNNETVFSGGVLFLQNNNNASNTVVSGGGELLLSGSEKATNTTLVSGGKVILDSPKALLSGSLTFSGGGNTLLLEGKLASSGSGGLSGTISGFSSTDQIVVSGGSTDSVSVVSSGGAIVATVSSGGQEDILTFSGAQYTATNLVWNALSNGDEVLTLQTPGTTDVTTSTASGAYTEANGDTLIVLSGGSVTAPTIESGAFLVVNGGTDSGAIVKSGATETVSSGAAANDQITGSAVVSGGSVTGETVLSGGSLTVAGGAAGNTVLDGGATLTLASGQLTGGLTFANGHNTFVVSAGATGDGAVVSGYQGDDKIEISGFGYAGATLSFTSGTGSEEIATVTSGGQSESFTFNSAAVYNAGTMSLAPDGANLDLVLDTTPVVSFTTLNNLSTNQSSYVVNGTVNVEADPYAIGTTVSVIENGQTIGTGTVGSDGYWHASVALANTDGANALTASDTDLANNTGVTSQSLTLTADTSAPAFTKGNLVISISGDGDGSGVYGDNQASPMTLEQITTSGQIVSQIVPREASAMVSGVDEYAVSSEYGSSSEGILQLSADGHSLTIAGYGIDDAVYNAGGAAVYGNAAEAQSTSIQGGPYTAVARVLVDVNANGSVDSSTGLYNVYNTNNPRSVVTTNGSTFFVSGQGDKNAEGSPDQGVFSTTDSTTTGSPTSLYSAADTRSVEIYDDELYFSLDSKQSTSPGVYTLGSDASPTTATELPGMTGAVTLTATNGNTVNDAGGAGAGTSVYLSPEEFYFANSSTLYVADGGAPKNGGVGDGGLQKWSLVGGNWQLDYTLSAGLNLINNDAGSSATGDTGLIGLTGEVDDNTGAVTLYATTEPLNDLGATAVVEITDQLSDTTNPGDDSFSTVLQASPGENIRGISFAPTPCYCKGVRILTDRGEVAVEALRVGDLAVTASGALRPVRWIGHRRLDLSRHPDPLAVRPVRVAANAFGEGLPHRDLWLSPGHNVVCEDALTPISVLVNGQSVTQIAADKVEYWHVELDAHDILLAEGLPAESYLDTGNRTAFANGGAFVEAYPDFAPRHWAETCLPLVKEGPSVVRARARLLARLAAQGHEIVRDAAPHIVVDGRRIEPTRLSATRLAFALPPGGCEIVLWSRTFIPAHTVPEAQDGRELGLCVARLRVDGVEIALDEGDVCGAGWREAEYTDGRFARRWTDGAASLPAGARTVEVELEGFGSYWREDEPGVELLARRA